MIWRSGGLIVALALAACAGEAGAKLEELALTDETRAALARLRFAPLRVGDRVRAGDVILCGGEDRVLLAFPKRLMVDYLGIDAGYLVPELFPVRSETELYLEVPAKHLMRLFIPPGIGGSVAHPDARVREADGAPNWSGDLHAIDQLFVDRQIFARTLPSIEPAAAPVEPIVFPKEASPPKPRRIGISPFPRMGPRSGVVIERVLADGPAQKAKLQTGDKIVAVNGVKVGDIYELKGAVESSRGPNLVLSVQRAGQKNTETVTLSFE